MVKTISKSTTAPNKKNYTNNTKKSIANSSLIESIEN